MPGWEQLAVIAQLSPGELAFVAVMVFIASVVRGFSGFALSALVMASAVAVLPPIELIPICYVLEGAAGVMMARGGFRDADMGVVWGLVIGSAIGVPIGLAVTVSLSTETSTLVALALILVLAASQLFRASPRFLATRSGLYGSGLTAGIVTGLAHVGGMVVALYVLARQAPAKTMRASLVMFLLISMLTSIIYQLGFGVMDTQAATRGLLLAPLVVVGVMIGSWLFRPSMEKTYKRFCLVLLMGLAGAGLVRMGM